MTLDRDSSSVFTLPGGYTGQLPFSFDADSSATYTISFTQTTRSSSNTLYATLISIGNGNVSQTAPIGNPQSYTPSAYQGFGTPTNVNLRWYQQGSNLVIFGRFNAGTTTAAEARVQLPPGMTISTPGGVTIPVGQTTADVGATNYPVILAEDGKQYVTFGRQYLSSTAYTKLNGNDFTASTGLVSFHSVSIPIAEFAGSVNTAPVPAEEFAYNTSTATAASDSTSFGYGPQGAQIQNITAFLERRVRFQYPIQSDDEIAIEVSEDRTKWYPLTNVFLDSASTYNIMPYTQQNSNTYGLGRTQQVSSTDLDISFGIYAFAGGATYGAAGTAWSSGAGAAYWRVRKTKKAALPFANVSSDAAGLARSYSSLAKIRLNTGNGHGSTNTKVRRFTTTVVNTGTGITYADSSTLGATFTCTEAGIYAFEYADAFSGVNDLGLSLNSSQLTTNIGSITAADRLVHATTGAADYFACVSVTVALAVGDVVRPHTSGGAESTVPGRVSFTVQRIA
jgi:hypothetical protein